MFSSENKLIDLEKAIGSGSEEVEEFIKNEVLYRSFEKGLVDYTIQNFTRKFDVFYSKKSVNPKKFESNLSYQISTHPSGMSRGYNIRVGSSYIDEAEIMNSVNSSHKHGFHKVLDRDTVELTVVFRCNVTIDNYGISMNPTVFIVGLGT